MKLERLFHERVKGKFHTTINSHLGFKPNIWIACRIFYPKRVALQFNQNHHLKCNSLHGFSFIVKICITDGQWYLIWLIFAAYRSLIENAQSKETELNYNICANTTLKRFLMICHVEHYLAFSVSLMNLSRKLLFFWPGHATACLSWVGTINWTRLSSIMFYNPHYSVKYIVFR